jgi:hypothetical protein
VSETRVPLQSERSAGSQALADWSGEARGFYCLSLGIETPVSEIIKCVESADIDIGALSFSIHYPARRLRSDLKEIRALLPRTVAVIAGGGAIGRIKAKLPGIILSSELFDAVTSLDGFGTGRSGQPITSSRAGGLIGEPPKAVLRDFGTIDGILGG